MLPELFTDLFVLFYPFLATASAPRSAIETHGMSASGQRLPSAMELSLHKAHRDRQVAQALMEQRQLTGYGLNPPQTNVRLNG